MHSGGYCQAVFTLTRRGTQVLLYGGKVKEMGYFAEGKHGP